MFRSFFAAMGSLFFAILFLLILQLDWKGQTLEAHLTSWAKKASFTKFLQKKSKILQVKINKKIIELKKEWAGSVTEKSNKLSTKLDYFTPELNESNIDKTKIDTE